MLLDLGFFCLLLPANFTFSKSTIETIEKGVKYGQSYQRHQNDVIHVVLLCLLLTLSMLRIFFLVFLLLTFNCEMFIGLTHLNI